MVERYGRRILTLHELLDICEYDTHVRIKNAYTGKIFINRCSPTYNTDKKSKYFKYGNLPVYGMDPNIDYSGFKHDSSNILGFQTLIDVWAYDDDITKAKNGDYEYIKTDPSNTSDDLGISIFGESELTLKEFMDLAGYGVEVNIVNPYQEKVVIKGVRKFSWSKMQEKNGVDKRFMSSAYYKYANLQIGKVRPMTVLESGFTTGGYMCLRNTINVRSYDVERAKKSEDYKMTYEQLEEEKRRSK